MAAVKTAYVTTFPPSDSHYTATTIYFTWCVYHPRIHDRSHFQTVSNLSCIHTFASNRTRVLRFNAANLSFACISYTLLHRDWLDNWKRWIFVRREIFMWTVFSLFFFLCLHLISIFISFSFLLFSFTAKKVLQLCKRKSHNNLLGLILKIRSFYFDWLEFVFSSEMFLHHVLQRVSM